MNLKGQKERRAEIEESLDNILKLAEKEKRELSENENKDYEKLESELNAVIDTIGKLERQEERKISLAKDEVEKRKMNEEVEGKKGAESEVKVTNSNKKTEEFRNAKVFQMIQGSVLNNSEQVAEARKELAEGGHYDDILKGEKRNFSTLTDAKGAIFLPTAVSDKVLNIAQEYGVVPRLTMNLGNILEASEIKVPQIMGRPTFTAVNQGSAISGSGFNLGGISLKPLKWGAIIDWTNEVDESVGAKLMPIVMKQVGEAQAYTMDNVFFNATGTSAYNDIQGLEGLTGTVNYVRTATADSDHDAFAELLADDFLKPLENVAPGARSGGRYVMHPNMIFNLMKLKDTAGNYIYRNPSEVGKPATLWSYPIELSEAFAYTDGVTKTAAAFFNPAYVAFATGRSLTATKLTEATITNENGTSVNLATTDAQAIRLTFLFDLKLSTITRTTGGTAQGAFSVLRTFS